MTERALVISGVTSISRWRRRRDILILAYHNVRRPGERRCGDASLHLAYERFGRQLDALQRTHDVIPLASAFAENPNGTRPRAVITFDDAYGHALEAVTSELKSRGMPATIFVAPGLLGQVTWWDRLSNPTAGAVRDDVRELALRELRGNPTTVLDRLGHEAQPDAKLPRIATEEELELAAGIPRITLGSHSWSHSNLSALTAPEIEWELRSSLEWLRSRFSNVIPWLSYPYGLSSPLVERIASEAGYVGGLRVEGGWVDRSRPVRPYAIPRYNVASGLSNDGFRLRIAGFNLS